MPHTFAAFSDPTDPCAGGTGGDMVYAGVDPLGTHTWSGSGIEVGWFNSNLPPFGGCDLVVLQIEIACPAAGGATARTRGPDDTDWHLIDTADMAWPCGPGINGHVPGRFFSNDTGANEEAPVVFQFPP